MSERKSLKELGWFDDVTDRSVAERVEAAFWSAIEKAFADGKDGSEKRYGDIRKEVDTILALVLALEQRAEAAERERDEAAELLPSEMLRSIADTPTADETPGIHWSGEDDLILEARALLARHDAKGGEG